MSTPSVSVGAPLPSGFERTLSSGMAFDCADLQIVQYRWTHAMDGPTSDSALVLRRRMWPSQIQMSASIAAGPKTGLGRLMMSAPDEPWHLKAEGRAGRALVIECRFRSAWVEEMLGIPLAPGRGGTRSSPNVFNAHADFLMLRIGQEFARPDKLSRCLMESLTSALTVEVARHVNGAGGVIDPPGAHVKFDVRDVLALIESADAVLRPGDLAAAMGMSVVHLRRLFKTDTGESLHAAINRDRTKRACELLIYTDLPLKDIAYQLGFSAHGSFCLAFRQALGVAPAAFRRTGRAGGRNMSAMF